MTTRRYAENTTVTSAASRDEIERLLDRYGATAYAYGWEKTTNSATLMFEIAHRHVRFRLPMPDRNDRAFTHTPARGQRRDQEAAAAEYDKAVRQRWRALALIIKAKLEGVTAGITSIEDEFLANTLVPGANGMTVSEMAQPVITTAYTTGDMPALLPGIGK